VKAKLDKIAGEVHPEYLEGGGDGGVPPPPKTMYG